MPQLPQELTDQQVNALATYFGGDRCLFDACLVSCLAQFSNDLKAGEQALLSGDLQGMRFQAHNLKTVLRTLGYTAAADLAQSLELACLAGQVSDVALQWGALRAQLQALVSKR